MKTGMTTKDEVSVGIRRKSVSVFRERVIFTKQGSNVAFSFSTVRAYSSQKSSRKYIVASSFGQRLGLVFSDSSKCASVLTKKQF